MLESKYQPYFKQKKWKTQTKESENSYMLEKVIMSVFCDTNDILIENKS